MSAASARAALIDLASTWRRRALDHATGAGYPNTPRAVIYNECAKQLDEATITHLSSSVTTDQSSSTWTLLRQAVSVCAAAMASEGISASQRERVVNVVLYGHPDGAEAARITGRTTERPDQ